MLQDASSKLGFSPKYTNAIAQQLKDGDGLGGLGALITYHRTDSNRMKIYVNGTQETSFATSSYPDEDAAFNFGIHLYVFLSL